MSVLRFPIINSRVNIFRTSLIRRKGTKPEAKCAQKCEDPRFAKLKKLQAKFQEKPQCPVWLLTPTDKLLYYSTMGLCVFGLFADFYCLLLRDYIGQMK